MAIATQAEPRGHVDHSFLNDVEIEIARALERATKLEAGLGSFAVGADNSWQDAFTRLSANLANWQNRLGNLTRQTAVLESDLNEQERAMRGWFQALGVTSDRLAELSRR